MEIKKKRKIYLMADLLLCIFIICACIYCIPNKKVTAKSFEDEGNIKSINDDIYLTNTKVGKNITTYQLKKLNIKTRVVSNEQKDTLANAIGLTNEQYELMEVDIKKEIDNAKSIFVQEVIMEVPDNVVNNEDILHINYENKQQNVKTTIPDHVSNNGYIKFRITATDTGEKFEKTNHRILYFHVEIEWLKLPVQRFDDFLAFALPSDFRTIENSTGDTSWFYSMAPSSQNQGMPLTGTMHGIEKKGNWWDDLLDGGYRFNNKSNDSNTRDVMTFDLPNKTNFYTPAGHIKCGYGYRVEDKSDGGHFDIHVVYGHDQTLFGANAPSVSIKGLNIELGGKHKEYSHTVRNIQL